MTSETKRLPGRFAPRIDGQLAARIDYEPHIDAYVKAYRRRHSTFRERLRTAWMRGLAWSMRPFP